MGFYCMTSWTRISFYIVIYSHSLNKHKSRSCNSKKELEARLLKMTIKMLMHRTVYESNLICCGISMKWSSQKSDKLIYSRNISLNWRFKIQMALAFFFHSASVCCCWKPSQINTMFRNKSNKWTSKPSAND